MSSTRTTIMLIAAVNLRGIRSRASETSSSNRSLVISTGIGSPARCGCGWRGVADALHRVGHRAQSAAVRQQGADLAVDLVRTGVPTVLRDGVPGRRQLVGAQVRVGRVTRDHRLAQLAQHGLLLLDRWIAV